MASDVQWSEAEFQLLGLNEQIDKRLLPPGQLVMARNAEFSSESGSVRKRPGVQTRSSPAGGTPGGGRLGVFRDQLVMLDYAGGGGTVPALYMPNEHGGGWERDAEIPVPTLTRTPVSADLGGVVLGDVCAVETLADSRRYLVYGLALHTAADNPSDFSAMMVRVVERASGSVVLEKVVKSAYRSGGFVPNWVRAAASGDYALVTFGYEDPGTHVTSTDILGFVVDCSTADVTVGSEVVITTKQTNVPVPHDGGAANSPKHDLCGLSPNHPAFAAGTPRWALSYSHFDSGVPMTTPTLRTIGLSTPALIQDWVSDVGDYPAAISCIANASGGYFETVWLNWVNNGWLNPEFPDPLEWMFNVLDSETGMPNFADTVWDVDVGGIGYNAWTSGISPSATAGRAVLMHSQATYGVDLGATRTLGWRRAYDDGTMETAVRHKRNAEIVAKPWRDPVTANWHHVWVGVFARWPDTLQIDSSGNTNPAVTYALLHVPEYDDKDERGGDLNKVSLEASCLTELAHGVTTSGSPYHSGNPPASSCAYDGAEWHVVLPAKFLPGEASFGPQDVAASWAHLGRGSSVEFGACTYFAGGVPTMWDGARLSEVGFLTPPLMAQVLGHATTGSGGEWGGTGDVQYAAVFEVVNAAGERTLSAVSDIRTVNVTNATTSEVTVNVGFSNATRRFWTAAYERVMPHVVVTLYRTPKPNDVLLKRIYTFDNVAVQGLLNDPDGNFLTFVDGGKGDTKPSVVETHELLYAGDPAQTSGELENDHPVGGCTCLAVHKERLWLGGCDDPEIVWYSKERAGDRTAEFSIGQQVRIPGRRVVALGSLGDALAVFCERGIYAIFGEGPNARGDPSSGQFSEPVTISTSIGCVGPRSVVPFPGGLFFQAEPGIYLLNQARQLVFVGETVKRLFAEFPVVRSAKVVDGKNQVRFVLSDAAGDFGTVLVYDWHEDRWAEWRHVMAPWADASNWVGHGFSYLTPDGYLYEEDDAWFQDGTSDYKMRLETGWIPFGRVQGYKRIRKVGILFEDLVGTLGAYGLSVRMEFRYNENLYGIRSWSSVEIAAWNALEPQWVRVTCPYQVQPSIRLAITEDEPVRSITGTATDASVVITISNNELKVKDAVGDPFTTITITPGTYTKAELAAALNAAFDAAGLGIVATVDGSNHIVLSTTGGPGDQYLAVDAAGSSMSGIIWTIPPDGTAVAASTGTGANAGFAIQSLAFEYGHMPGIRRLPALQSR